MKDIFKEFQQATLKTHLAIGGTALAFALGVNVLLFNTDTGARLQASAIEATSTVAIPAASDISLVQGAPGTDRVQIQLNRAVQGLKSLELTLLADPSTLILWQAAETEGGTPVEIVPISSMSGVVLLKLRYPNPVDLVAGTSVASIAFKKSVAGTSPINIAAPRMVTTGGEYELSSQGVEAQ